MVLRASSAAVSHSADRMSCDGISGPLPVTVNDKNVPELLPIA